MPSTWTILKGLALSSVAFFTSLAGLSAILWTIFTQSILGATIGQQKLSHNTTAAVVNAWIMSHFEQCPKSGSSGRGIYLVLQLMQHMYISSCMTPTTFTSLTQEYDHEVVLAALSGSSLSSDTFPMSSTAAMLELFLEVDRNFCPRNSHTTIPVKW